MQFPQITQINAEQICEVLRAFLSVKISGKKLLRRSACLLICDISGKNFCEDLYAF